MGIKYQIGYCLKILFVGINPHPESYRKGIPFSNNKMFWYLLHDAGLIAEPRELLKNDLELKKLYFHKFKKIYRFGLIGMIDRPTITASKLKKFEAIPGKKRLIAAIKKYEPLIVCFIGKISYRMFTGLAKVNFGWQPSISSSRTYVMHSPNHGLAKIRIRELREIDKVANHKGH